MAYRIRVCGGQLRAGRMTSGVPRGLSMTSTSATSSGAGHGLKIAFGEALQFFLGVAVVLRAGVSVRPWLIWNRGYAIVRGNSHMRVRPTAAPEPRVWSEGSRQSAGTARPPLAKSGVAVARTGL